MTGADIETLDLQTVLARSDLSFGSAVGQSSGRIIGLSQWLRRLGIRGVCEVDSDFEEVTLQVGMKHPPEPEVIVDEPEESTEEEIIVEVSGRLIVDDDEFRIGGFKFNVNHVNWVLFEEEQWSAL